MTSDDAASTFAHLLRVAEQEGTAAPLASEVFQDLDWKIARRIAVERDKLRSGDNDTRIGYKLGWTSATMREALGVDRPNWGTLWRSQRIDDRLDLTRMRHAKVEPEIVYVAERQLGGSDVDAIDVLANASGWAVGIEVVHPRWESFRFSWLDNTADNSSAQAVAIGSVRQLDADPSTLEIEFSDDAETRTGRGDQAMGSPAESVAWLVRQLDAEGQSIHAGDIVFTGGLTAPFDVSADSHYTASCAELGTVEISTGRGPSREHRH